MAWKAKRGSNPDLLTEVTYGEVGIAPMMEKSSTGRMSPVRGRTMKEYDQQLGELKKENFNLKLRIYFMEERMNTKFNEEDVIKHNIELKVEMENYKKDLVEKQALLEKASETIDTLTSKYSEELEKEVINIKQECDDKVERANQHAFELENELSVLENKLQELEEECDKELTPKLEMKDKQIQELTVNLEERDKEICNLEENVKALKKEVTELKDHSERREEQLREEMECIRTNLGRKDRDIQRLSFIVQDKTSIEGVTALERDHFKDEVEDTKRGLERLQKNCDKQNKDLDKKSQLIGKLEDLLRAKEKEKQALQKAYDERTTVYTRSKGIISDLVKDTHIKEQKIKSLEEELRQLREELEALKEELQKANLNRQKDADKIRELEENIEKLVRTLGKREGELENFRDLLERAQNSLTMSEEAVECLQKQLEKERCKDRSREKREDNAGEISRLRKELADLHAELKEREKHYQAKCDELDTVAQRLNIKVTTQSNGSDQSDMLQKIMGELQQLKGAVESERHLHIDINSTHMSGTPDGSPPHNTHMSRRTGSPPYSTHTLSQTDGSQPHDLDVVRPGSIVSHLPTVMGKNGSRIPVPRKSSTNSAQDETESLLNKVTELNALVHDLKSTLKATEETCHCQTQKMKNYRNLLVENGLLPRLRSNSVPNMRKNSLSPGMESRKTRRLSIGGSDRCRSVSPSPVHRRQTLLENPENMDKLVKENSKLKQQVDGYRRVLKVFQSRSPSPSEETDGSRPDGEPAPMTSESASCLLSSWLDMLDKFLTELSHSDQQGLAQCPTSNMEVTRLRRGLVQARGAIQSLSETSLVEQDKLSEGRLSPDSGCSDNPASAHNTLKESPSTSPTGRKSTSPRSDVSSPRNNAGSQFPEQYSDKLDGAQSTQVQGYDNTTSDKMRFQSNGSSTGSQSSTSFDSDFAHRRDAGADPRLSSQNSYQSIERLRQYSGAPNLQNMSVFSQLDSDASVFSTASVAPMTNGFQKPGKNTVPNIDIGDGAIQEPKHIVHDKQLYLDQFEQTFSPSFLGGEGDETFANFTNIGQQSLLKLDDMSLLDITSHDNIHYKTSNAEMQERIKSLEDIIHTYEEQIKKKSRPDMDSLHQQLAELRNLRIQLEKAMARNEILEKQIADLYRFSESTIKELKTQLEESDSSIKNKMKIISEKEKIITETKMSLEQYKDNSARDSADLELFKNKINSLEFELKNSKKTCEQLTEMCQQLKTAVEQYRRRSTQLEDDNKQHIEAVTRYESKVKELQEDVISRSELGSQTEALKSRVSELESDYQQWRENENKYKHLLSQTRLQVTELSGDLEVSRDEVRKRDSELHTFKAELENLRDVVEEQNQHLGEKTRYIDELKGEVDEKNNCLLEQDTVCRNLTSKLENFTSANSKLSTQLEQQRLTCADYKRQIEKQNMLTKDLKDKIDKLREELSQSIHNRESQDKLLMERQNDLQESTRLKDKYLYNLKVTYKEFNKIKKELKEVKKKCEDTSVLNSTLQTELSVRERLMEDKGDMLTDDDKQNMIGDLLNELRLARIQMTKILAQNENIRQKLTEMIEQKKEQLLSQGTGQLAGSVKSEDSVDRSLTEEIPDISLGGNQTWPLYCDLTGGLPRTDNLSCSLPLRESTPGGPASSHHRSRRSDLPSQHSRKSDLPSQQSRQNDNKTRSTSSIQQKNEESNSRKSEEYLSVEFNLSKKSFTEEPALSSGNHFSVPGPIYKQGITDKCLLYNVNDSPKYLEGLTQVRIDSDIRSVFAIGMIDHFEKLRKEANESNVILKGLSTRVTERLKVFNTMPALEMIKSVEYSVLKEISYATENMRICLDSQLSLIGCFWTSELPAPNERGEFVNQKLLDKNSALREELATVMNTLDLNYGSKRNEEMICKSLESTLDVVSRARHNFEYQQQYRRYSPHRSPSHSPRK